MIERGPGNKVLAQVQKDLTSKGLNSLVRQRVNTEFTTIITDEYRGYAKLNQIVNHMSVDHSQYYALDHVNTNTIESFWSLLKRGIVGQYHKVSEKYLPLYLVEFCYRFNNRNHSDLFALTVVNSVTP